MKIILNLLTVCFILLSCQQKAKDNKVVPLPKSKEVNVSKKVPFEIRVANTPDEKVFEMKFISDTFHISVGKVTSTIINHTRDRAEFTAHPYAFDYYNELTASWDDILSYDIPRVHVLSVIQARSDKRGSYSLDGNEKPGRYRITFGLITPKHCNTVVGEFVLSADERFLKYNAKKKEETEKY